MSIVPARLMFSSRRKYTFPPSSHFKPTQLLNLPVQGGRIDAFQLPSAASALDKELFNLRRAVASASESAAAEDGDPTSSKVMKMKGESSLLGAIGKQ